MALEKLAEILKCQKPSIEHARALLEQAIETLGESEPGEAIEATARRIKGAAVLASTAVNELFARAGSFELAHEFELASPDFLESD